MEWLALLIWLVVALAATVLLLEFTLSIAVHAAAAVTATVVWAIFCAGGPEALGWIGVGLAVVALAAAGFAVAAIVDDESRGGLSVVSQRTQEHLASLAGLQVGLLVAVLALSVGAAAGLTAGTPDF